jgi:hypothetical protein
LRAVGFSFAASYPSTSYDSRLGGTTSPVSSDNLRLNHLASPSDFLKMAPACVAAGGALRR